MRTVSGLFDTYIHATEALHALRDAGIKSADISLIANNPEALYPGDPDPVGKDSVAGAEVGALLGGAGGLLAGLGVIAIPGLGPVLAGGWLVSAAMGALAGAGLGAATGGLVGLMTDAGFPKSDAHVYAEGIRRGGALVTARVTEAQAEAAMEILKSRGAADATGLRLAYQREGWQEMAEAAPTLTGEQPDERSKQDRDPTVPPML